MADIANDAPAGEPMLDIPLAELAELGIVNEPGMELSLELRVYRMFLELKFKPAAAKALIEDQDVNSMGTLREMSEDQITNLCKIIRRPGGSVQQPLAGIGRNANRTQQVAAYGAPIAMIHEENLKLARFYLKFKEMTSRTVEPEEVTVEAINEFRDFKIILEKGMKKGSIDLDVDHIPNLTYERTFEWFDEFREFLDERISSTSMRPLAYVVRATEAVKAEDSDPPTGKVHSTYDNYTREIRARAPIKQLNNTLDRHFAADNAAVWKILWLRLKKGKYHAYIKPFSDKQDARGAFQALHRQLLGKSAIANYANAAENRLSSLVLDGTRTKNWNFDKYLVQHKEQHMILNKLKEFDHAGISETSKMNYFVNGITDPAYEYIQGALAASPKHTFDEVVEAFRTYINGKKAKVKHSGTKRSINVAAVSTTTGNRTNDRAKKTGEQEDGFDITKDYSQYSIATRFYKVPEWNKLSKGQRNFLRKNSKLKNSNNAGKSGPSKTKRYIKSLEAKVAQLESTTISSDSDDMDEDDAPPLKKKKGSTFLSSKKR